MVLSQWKSAIPIQKMVLYVFPLFKLVFWDFNCLSAIWDSLYTAHNTKNTWYMLLD